MSEHISVLLKEAIESLNIKPNGVYVDMTLGGGGHSEEILKRLKQGHLYAFDQDQFAIDYASKRLASYPNKTFIHSNFETMISSLKEQGITGVDGVLFDLGVSSFQFDIPERGFSYNYDNPLDMRMNPEQDLTASVIVNTYSYEELTEILYRYGEESYARNIVRNIISAREQKPIETTFELVDIIKKSLPVKELRKKGHPAKQTFQALRIAVNDELGVFERAIQDAITILNPKGRLVVITFHSLEDRICKQILRSYSTVELPKGVPMMPTEKPVLTLMNRKVILPTEEELLNNNRSHSAKMRVAEKNE